MITVPDAKIFSYASLVAFRTGSLSSTRYVGFFFAASFIDCPDDPSTLIDKGRSHDASEPIALSAS